MSIRPLRSALIVLATCSTLGCSDAAGLDDFIVFITNSWEVVGNESYTFNFVSTDDGATSGNFTGTEFRTAADEGSPLVGAWSDNQVVFTVDRTGEEDVDFAGVITTDDPDELQLTSREGTIRIRKQ